MEKQVIQSVGFRNLSKDGRMVGFQFKIRLPYYRGVFLSQLMPGALFVDGERIGKEDIIWTLKGEEYTVEQMKQDSLRPCQLRLLRLRCLFSYRTPDERSCQAFTAPTVMPVTKYFCTKG